MLKNVVNQVKKLFPHCEIMMNIMKTMSIAKNTIREVLNNTETQKNVRKDETDERVERNKIQGRRNQRNIVKEKGTTILVIGSMIINYITIDSD